MFLANARHGLTAAGVALFAFGMVALHDAAVRQRTRFPAAQDVLYLPRPTVLKAASLGHAELAADLIFIRALVYFGTEVDKRGETQWLEHYLDAIYALDPEWQTPYRVAGVATMYNGQPITNAMVLRSNRYLELGAQRFPNGWELPFMLGCNYLFELRGDEAQKRRWRHIGGSWIERAALAGGAPPWVPLLAATILRQEGQEEAAVRHLESVYLSTQDEKTRAELRNRLVSLHAQIDLGRIDRERQAFESARKETLPYAAPALFVLTGKALPPRLDLAALSGLGSPAIEIEATE